MAKKLFECFICRKNFKSKKSNLLRHLNLHEPNAKRYKCPKCRKSYQNKENYHRHWAAKHTEISIEPEKAKMIEPRTKRM